MGTIIKKCNTGAHTTQRGICCSGNRTVSLGLLYFAMAVYALLRLPKGMCPAAFRIFFGVALVSLWTSVVSIRLPAGIAAAFGVLGAGTGVFGRCHRSSLGGVTAVGISALIHVIPNLNGVQKCAYHIAAGKVPVWHPVLVALFAAWVLVLDFCNPTEGGIKI